MSRFDSATVATTAFAAGVVLIALTGCAQMSDVFSKQHREDFPTYAAAADGWVGVGIPDWIPDDATDLRNLATVDETVSVIRVVTEADLAGSCETAAREGIPQLAADWSTDVWPDEVQRCGDYEVMPMEDGWLGWFQADEPGQTPD
jgi:hypothetical protein